MARTLVLAVVGCAAFVLGAGCRGGAIWPFESSAPCRHVEGASYCSMVPEAYDCTCDGRIVEVEDDRFCAKTYTVCVGKITSKRRINCHAENDCTPQGETCRAGSCVAPDRADAGDAAAPVL